MMNAEEELGYLLKTAGMFDAHKSHFSLRVDKPLIDLSSMLYPGDGKPLGVHIARDSLHR